jgi:hypothetical protein
MREPGRDLAREMAAGERADAQIETFISRRHDRRVADEGERPAEEIWMESERRYDARRRAENGAAWSTRYDVEDGLRWDAERSVWTASDGFAFDGSRLHDYSRNGTAA